MKLRKIGATLAAFGLTFSLVACGDDTEENGSADTTTSQAESQTAAPELPSAEQLNEILAVATNPDAPMEERRATVSGGETVEEELFHTLTHAQVESGAQFQVVPPVLPGYNSESILTTVNFTLPDAEPQEATDVEFVWEDGRWKLSQSWACTLVTNTVPPEQVPAMCVDQGAMPVEEAPAPAPEEGAPAPAPEEGAPAPAPAPEEAPAPAPAP